jgi:hypothetical protein
MNIVKAGETIIAVGEALAPKSTQVAEEAARALLHDSFGQTMEAASRAGVKLAPTVSEEASALLARAQKPAAELIPVASNNDLGIGFISLGGHLPPEAIEEYLAKANAMKAGPSSLNWTDTGLPHSSDFTIDWGPHDSTPWPQAVHDLFSKTLRKLDGKD